MSKSVYSVALSCCPFTSHNDGNRLQMAANFLKQSLILSNPDIPYISTEFLKKLTEQSFFYVLANSDNINILYRDIENLIYKENDSIELLRIPNSLWESTPKEKIKKGDYLIKHWAVKNDIYCYGKNLNVIFAPYYGWNYEDAIVITETGASKLTSRHIIEYEFIVQPGEIVTFHVEEGKRYKKGDIIFEIIEEPKNLVNVLCGGAHKTQTYADQDYIVEKIVTYYDEKLLENHHSSELFLKWVKKHSIQNRIINLQNIMKKIDHSFSKVISHHYPENYQVVNNPEAIIIRVYCLAVKGFKVGDKIGNRHGNKGVCSKIISDKDIKSDDNWIPDIILNPLGVPSRMNVGQIVEMHLSEVCKKVEKKLLELYEKKKYDNAYKLAKTFEKDMNGKIPYFDVDGYTYDKIQECLKNGFTIYVNQFTTNMYETVKKICKKYNIPVVKEFTFNNEEPYNYGYGTLYFSPLVHTVEAKFSTRSVGPYHSKTLQPISSESLDAGQRLGEMEIWSYFAYDTPKNLIEILGAKADDISMKESLIAHAIRTGLYPSEPEILYTNHLLHLYMYSLGINIDKTQIIQDDQLTDNKHLTNINE